MSLLPTFEEPVDQRYRIRFNLGDANQSALSHGYSIKFTLIDVQNLLLYQNIMELSYSSVNRVVKERTVQAPILRRKVTPAKVPWNEKTLRLLSQNFIEDVCKMIGEEYRLPVKKAMRVLSRKITAN